MSNLKFGLIGNFGIILHYEMSIWKPITLSKDTQYTISYKYYTASTTMNVSTKSNRFRGRYTLFCTWKVLEFC